MNPNSAYRPDIDGLRAVAVLAVVLHHLSASLVPGGYVGVDVFFVISGYLITRIISREMEEGTFTFARFYERRARRIFPALFAVLAVTLVAGYFLLLPSDYSGTLRGALGTLFFSSNIVFWRDMAAGYFAATDAGLNPLLHTWSLAVEEQFYVFFPFLLLLCYRHFRRHIILILIGCAVVSLAGAALLVQSKSVAVFFLSPFRAWELLVGSLLAFNAVPVIRSRALREAVAGAGLLAILIACFVYDAKTTFPGLAALAPVLGAAAIMHAGASGPSMVGRLMQWRPVVYIGLISYSLYLWHWPLIVLTRYAMGMEAITPYIPVLFAASLALGSLSYHFIEQPFRNSISTSRQVVYLSSAVVASLLITASILGLARGGLVERFAPAVVLLDKARSPDIPFIKCESKASSDWCILGASNIKPTVLLWGDSHMLAWAPVLNHVLTKNNFGAVIVTSPSCPPLLDVAHIDRPLCRVQNLAVKNYLLNNKNIKKVVMAAYWGFYFNEGSPLTNSTNTKKIEEYKIAEAALVSTLDWLRQSSKDVVLIGPVPVFEKSVPLVLALKTTSSSRLLQSSMDIQRENNASFFKVVKNVQSVEVNFRFLDPIKWLCPEICIVQKNGVSLYRDQNHLSVDGAMALETHISEGLTTATWVGLSEDTPIAVPKTP